MHAHNQIWIIIGNDDADPLTFDLSKITPLRIVLSFFSQRIRNDEFGIGTAQLVKPQPIPGVTGEPHAPLRARQVLSLPLHARAAELSPLVRRRARS